MDDAGTRDRFDPHQRDPGGHVDTAWIA